MAHSAKSLPSLPVIIGYFSILIRGILQLELLIRLYASLMDCRAVLVSSLVVFRLLFGNYCKVLQMSARN